MLSDKPRRVIAAARGYVVDRPRFTPGHFYSPITSAADAERAIAWKTDEVPVGVPMDLDEMAAFATELAPMWADLQTTARYRPAEMFCLADAAVLHAMLRTFTPRRVLEIGSGFSTACALDTISAHDLPTEITCVEPYPARLYGLLRAGDEVTVHEKLVQDVGPDAFTDLAAGDVLFIDSTHVAKAGSDVLWLILRVLPSLAPGVLVHIHDVFWPLEYKDSWLRNRMDWNEIYLLHAFLSGNPSWQVVHFNDYVWQHLPGLVAAWLPDAAGQRPGGIWLRKVA